MAVLAPAVVVLALSQLTLGLSKEACPAGMPEPGSSMLQAKAVRTRGPARLPEECVTFFHECGMERLPEATPMGVSDAFQKCCLGGGYSNATCTGIATDTILKDTGSILDKKVCLELVDLYAAHTDGPRGAKKRDGLVELALLERRGKVNGSKVSTLDEGVNTKCFINSHVCESDGCTPNQNTCNCDALTRHCCTKRCDFWED